jgi:hypothetical protein
VLPQIFQVALGKIHYYRRVLERILNINAWTIGKGLQGNKASKELIKAVEELQRPKEVEALTSGKLEVRTNQHSEQWSEEYKGNAGRIENEDPEPTETIKVKKDQVKEDREDAKELKRDGRNQIVTAEMIESQTVSDNRSTATGWFARKQLLSTAINEANTTRELLKLMVVLFASFGARVPPTLAPTHIYMLLFPFLLLLLFSSLLYD